MRKRIKHTYRRMKPKIHWFLNNEGASLSLSILVLLVTILLFIEHSPENLNPIDYTVFLTVITAVCLNFAAIFLSKFLSRYLEDDLKLTVEYDQLAGKYKEDLLEVKNELSQGVDYVNLLRVSKVKKVPMNNTISFQIPILIEGSLAGRSIIIKDNPDKMYRLPENIKNEFGHLFRAHAASKIYNQLNIRVNNWYINENGSFVIESHRTTYFDSLVTNRAMDFKWTTGVTNRDLYSYGPFVSTLEDSQLSNHLGFNGIIESKDGKIPFIKRGKNVSIAKGTYATNIAASLKAKYALNKEKLFTIGGLEEAIIQEIKDELKLEKEHLQSFEIKENLIAAYRDLVEGGKPQLLFYAKSTMEKDEIIDNFTKNRKVKRKNKFEKDHIEFQVLEDGTNFMWIPKEELNEIAFTSEYMVHNGKLYNMVPSTIASVYMIREYLREKGDI